MREAAAIVGMACRYPGARSPRELWENALAGRRAFRRIPPERLRLADYLSPGRGEPDSIYSTQAAVLEDWVFDRLRFRVGGPSHRAADLAHWLALEVAADALADAGFPDGHGLPREAAGVVIGNTLTGEVSRSNLLRLRWPYVRRVVTAGLSEAGVMVDEPLLARLEALYKEPFPPPDEESLAGGLANTIAGRIANHFDLGGGGYTVDGACASSLLAVAQAASALAAGDLDVALAGGVDLSLDPFELVGFARTGALAAGAMRVYDERSDGFIPGEGCGVVVLMRLADAEAAGRRVRAVVRGWGVSSDGEGGLTRPEPRGQLRALARAYRRAGLSIAEVPYFEGHGTGTAVGDAAELEALSRARREALEGARGERRQPAAVGSVKAIVGHTKAAAGVAGLIKAALALEAQTLPPTVGCERPHALLSGPDAALRALPRGEPWPAAAPLVAGVSAMGFGGINAHVVLAGAAPAARRQELSARQRLLVASPQDAELFLVAGDDAGELAGRLERWSHLAERLSLAEMGDLAARLAADLEADPGRGTPAPPGRLRAAAVACTPAGLARRLARLAGWLREGPPAGAEETAGSGGRLDAGEGVFLGRAGTPPRLGLLFPGQGAPAPATGGALAARFEAAAALYAEVALPAGADRVATDVAQPAIVAASLAALRVLDAAGVEAAVAVGHSLGELVALHWAGAFDEAALLGLAAERGRAMAAAGGAGDAGEHQGAMASVAAPPAAVAALLDGGVVVAAHNGPGDTVVSGPAEAVERLLARARAAGHAASRLAVSAAFHSPAMAPAAPRLAAAVAAAQPRPPRRRVVSTVYGRPLAPGDDLTRLLVEQLTRPVRFVEALAAAGRVDLWIEVGPGQVASGLAARCGAAPAIAIDAGSPSLGGLLLATGAAFALGAPVAVGELFAGRFTRPFDPERPMRFIANPCESAPCDGEKQGGRASQPGSGVDAGGGPLAEEAEPGGPEGEGTDPLAVVRALVAERVELPLAAVARESRLLGDLHLNSIAVGQLVGEAARRLGRAAPAAVTEYSGATVGEVAEALAAQPRRGERSGEGEGERWPAGVDSWVRAFAVEWVERPEPAARPAPAGGARGWRVLAAPGDPLARSLEGALAGIGGGGVAVCLPGTPDAAAIGLLLAAARALAALPPPAAFVVVPAAGWGAAFARTLHLERPGHGTAVVALPRVVAPAEMAARVAREAVAALASGSYREAQYDEAGRRSEPVLRPLPPAPASSPGELPLGPDDVVLATGGGKGIGAECALALARASGARLALLGRARPEADAALAANLDRLRAAGVGFSYHAADVTDPAATAAAIGAAQAAVGPITAVLHAAGANTPRLIAALDEAAFASTLAPKVAGLDNVLAALDPARLRLLVAFGSIIARAGLPGEADYATANEWLARRVEAFATVHPSCRCLTVEWSVWSGVGMGERLGRVEALLREGIAPIPPAAGVSALLDLLRRPPAAPTVVVSSRFGAPPTLRLERPELPLLRFLETPRVDLPGVELVVDCELSADSDPYLADHQLGGERLLPAVMGLEAMAQAAMAVAGEAAPPAFEDVAFLRPVVVPADGRTRLRVAVLVREPGRVEAVVRCAATGFAADHFRATCRFAAPPSRATAPGAAPGEEEGARALGPRLPLDPRRVLYGDLLFQRGRFARLAGYRRLSATDCLAEVSPDGRTEWFGRYLPAALVLGDPGARDAALHGVQACVPHTTLLPVGVERIETVELPTDQGCRVAARERRREGDSFVYDLEIATEGGARERWLGLRLRAVTAPAPRRAWPLELLAPYVQRRLEELVPGRRVTVAIERGAGGEDGAAGGASGSRAADGSAVALARAGGLVLAVTGAGPLGCALRAVEGDGDDGAATRLRAAAECLSRAGAAADPPLAPAAGTADGWVVVRSGRLAVATLVTGVGEEEGRLALAVAMEAGEADVLSRSDGGRSDSGVP